MNFTHWFESRRDLETAVLSSIDAYGGEEENPFWLGKRIRSEFQSSSEVRKKMLSRGMIRQLLGDRNAVEFIRANDPTFGEFVNWLLQNAV